MKTYTHTKFEGHYPVGSAAIIVAPDEETALTLLKNQLELVGLDPDSAELADLKLVDSARPHCCILLDGDY